MKQNFHAYSITQESQRKLQKKLFAFLPLFASWQQHRYTPAGKKTGVVFTTPAWLGFLLAVGRYFFKGIVDLVRILEVIIHQFFDRS